MLLCSSLAKLHGHSILRVKRERKHAVCVCGGGLMLSLAGRCMSDHSRSFFSLFFPPHPILTYHIMHALSSDNLPALEALCHMKLFFHSIQQKPGLKIINRGLPRRFYHLYSLTHLLRPAQASSRKVIWGQNPLVLDDRKVV